MKGWGYYQTRYLAVVPYMPGTPVYMDGLLPHLYYKTRDEGNLPRLFHEDGFNLDKFVAFFEARKTMQCLCRIENDRRIIPVGYSWCDTPSGVDGARGALIGFAFFREAKCAIRDLGRLGLAYMFMDMKIDILHGVILEWNTPAVNYAKRLGFKSVAYVPKWRYVNGEMTGVHVLQLEKEDFLPRFEKWFEKQIPIENPASTS